MSVDHRRLHALVPQELLQGSNVVAVDQQVGGEGVAEGMAGRQLDDPRSPPGIMEGALKAPLVEMMAPALSGAGVPVEAGRRKDELPAPLPRRPGILPRQEFTDAFFRFCRPQTAFLEKKQ